MAEIVKVTHLKKSFGRFEALKDVSFTVKSTILCKSSTSSKAQCFAL